MPISIEFVMLIVILVTSFLTFQVERVPENLQTNLDLVISIRIC